MINIIMNKYLRWYNSLIETRRNRSLPKDVYTEKHHIIPRSLGGDNSKDNLIVLLPREHFIAHLLLAKIHTGKDGMKMAHALMRMLTGGIDKRYRPNSRTYSVIRSITMKQCSGENNHMTWRTGHLHPSWGKKEEIYNDEFKSKVGAASKGRKWTPEQRAKRVEQMKAYWADPANRERQSKKLSSVERSDEWKRRISESQKGRVQSDETRAKISAARQKK